MDGQECRDAKVKQKLQKKLENRQREEQLKKQKEEPEPTIVQEPVR